MITNLLNRTVECVIELLPTKNIKIAKYQKALNKKRVQSIIDNFDPHRMRPIEVSYRDGQYWVFDGQHRLAAYLAMGIAIISCQIHYGLTYEEEALLFAHQQDNVRTVNTIHKWNALCEAQESIAVKIKEIALKHGYTVGMGGVTNRRILAVKAIQDIVNNLGYDGLDTILGITKKCWNGDKHAMSYDMLGGLSIFMCAHNKDAQYKYERLVESLIIIDSSALLKRASAMGGTNRKVRVAKAIEFEYNKKSRGKMRLATKV